MPRKLKTYITNLGFFEMAIAAPSMKAALEAWNMDHNAFKQGFAKETDDPKIVAATMAKPGVVLKRGAGTTGAFTENPELPKELGKGSLPKIEPRKKKAKPPAKIKATPKKPGQEKAERAAIVSFEKAKEKRERERQKEQQRQEAEEEKRQARIERAQEKASNALETAREKHEARLKELEAAVEEAEERLANERESWKEQREKLEREVHDARR